MITELISDYGFPIVATVGMGYFVYFIWKWVTDEVKPLLGQTTTTLIGLIDRVRMLDNDMIRLTQKINMVIEFKEEYEKLTGKKLNISVDEIEKMKKEQKNVGKNNTLGRDSKRQP